MIPTCRGGCAHPGQYIRFVVRGEWEWVKPLDNSAAISLVLSAVDPPPLVMSSEIQLIWTCPWTFSAVID